jgi:hypothetical protein
LINVIPISVFVNFPRNNVPHEPVKMWLPIKNDTPTHTNFENYSKIICSQNQCKEKGLMWQTVSDPITSLVPNPIVILIIEFTKYWHSMRLERPCKDKDGVLSAFDHHCAGCCNIPFTGLTLIPLVQILHIYCWVLSNSESVSELEFWKGV